MIVDRKVPDSDHVARYCKPTTISESGMPTGAAFLLRLEKEEEALSVNWLEFLDANSRSDAIEKLRQIFIGKFRSISTNAKFAVLNVGEMVTYVHNESDHLLRVLHEPIDNDPSHCGIHNLPLEKEQALLVGELIAEKVCELHRIRSSSPLFGTK